VIQAEHLTKKYRKKTAVDDLTFTVETGKVTGFLGPNGAGKSTTMRLMLGLDNGSGKTTFDGKLLHEYTQPSQVIGILLEAKAFHPTRLARRHLQVLASAGGIADSRVEEALDMVGLREVGKKGPGKFSLGMSQRLGIAAAILGKPKYLMLDEPANGLDPEGIAWLRQFIKDYAAEGNAVFVSSHLLSEMALMADNLVVIGKGKMIANTSMKAMLDGSMHQGVFVRTNNTDKLETVLTEKQMKVQKQDGGLIVGGVKTDDVGVLAHGAGLTVLELTHRSATLEEAFLELTAGSEEYVSHSDVADAAAKKGAK
jgi:ABC-2 type transport system ATP-binding protein